MIGVDPRVGVAVEGEPEHAYLAVGYFVQLPSHPLHAGIEWTPRPTPEQLALEQCTKYLNEFPGLAERLADTLTRQAQGDGVNGSQIGTQGR